MRHTLDVFSNWSKGDVESAASTVNSINAANLRNLRGLIKGSLGSVGRFSDRYEQTNEIDPSVYDKKVGMTQKTEDTFVATEVVRGKDGTLGLISLAFTTRLREEVRKMLGEPQSINSIELDENEFDKAA